ncbi:MAG: HlyD family efflux transporter periplasmic adaptor subunit [Saprospiraceae bacterium]|nr:HlyD family efflux transporter periplasmic adaptor subunit [Saprospiraceae bacterium]
MKHYSFQLPALLILSVLMVTSCRNNGLEFDASGTFEATDVIVSAEVAGRILSFHANEGDTLSAGTIVAQIDPLSLSLQKEQIEATKSSLDEKTMNAEPLVAVLKGQIAAQRRQIDVLAGQMSVLQREKERFSKLVRAEAVPRKQLEDIEGQIDILSKQQVAARSQVDVLEIQIAAQRIAIKNQNRAILSERGPLDKRAAQVDEQLARTEVRNPLSGTVLITYAEAGEITGPGKPLYKIAKTDTLFLRTYLTGGQLPSVKLGQSVQVMVDDGQGGYRSYPGTVTWIADQAEFTPKTIMTRDERANLVYATKVRVANDGLLKIGMYAEVDLSK